MSEELKPCAHCGSSDIEDRESVSDYYVACCNCGARTGLVYLGASDAANAFKKREAIAAWNKRASDADTIAAAVIRTYGDERHAAGYQAAIADVVEWLGVEAELIRNLKDDTDIAASIQNLEVLARARDLIANEITRRFGKGQ